MEVSSTHQLQGEELIQTVIQLTGLPQSWLKDELMEFLESSGKNNKNINLDQLREILLSYLERVHADFLTNQTLDA